MLGKTGGSEGQRQHGKREDNDGGPAFNRVKPAARRTHEAGANIIGEHIERRGVAFGAMRQLADKAASDGMAHEEAGREHNYTEDDDRERGRERQRAAGGGECQTEEKHGEMPDPVSEQTADRRGADAEEIDSEDQPEFGLVEAVGRRHETETGIIVDRHEGAHRQEGDGEDERQRRIAEMTEPGLEMKARIEARPADEIA